MYIYIASSVGQLGRKNSSPAGKYTYIYCIYVAYMCVCVYIYRYIHIYILIYVYIYCELGGAVGSGELVASR